jgi:hypothetical protein
MGKIMAKRTYWKITLVIIVVILIGSGFAGIFGRRKTNVPAVGQFILIGYGNSPTIRIKKNDGTLVDISYENNVCEHKIVMHPDNHPLNGRVRAMADGKTLHELTELFPTLVRIAKGEEKDISERVLRALDDFPADRYRFNFQKKPGKFRLEINDNLYLKGYDFQPNAQMPYVAYWGPEGADGLGDDVIYCGEWALDKFCQNLPLKVRTENLHRVKAGDTINFAGCELVVEYIDWDNDQDPRNNSLILRVEGSEDLARIKESGDGAKPVTPEEFVKVASWPKQSEFQWSDNFTSRISAKEFEEQITAFAAAKTNKKRADVTKQILLNAGYAKDNLKTIDNGYKPSEGSEDIWIVKQGKSEDVVIIAAHYDKTGKESQGVNDNACGVVVVASVANHIQTIETELTYIFLFFGAEEVGGRNWSQWLIPPQSQNAQQSQVLSPIRYAVNVEGGGLIGAKQTFCLAQSRMRGWLYWRFPQLRINETGGPPDYLKHTAKDNINSCDFTRLVESQNSLLNIVLAIEGNLSRQKSSDSHYKNMGNGIEKAAIAEGR